MLRLVLALLVAVSLQAASTTVSGTVTDAQGNNITGTAVVSWPSFLEPDGELVVAGQATVTITNGALSVVLAPNVGATPSGTSYAVRIRSTDRTFQGQETWVVPDTGTATIATVRTSTPPVPSAFISLSALSTTGGSEGQVIKIVSGAATWAADSGGGGGGGDSYSFLTDGTTTAAASSADTFKLRSANNRLTVAAHSNDVTHGDGFLFTLNEGNLSVAYSQLTSVPSTFAPAAHALVGATHTVSGLTTGQLLQATGATSYDFGDLAEAQVTAHQAALDIAWAQLTGVPSSFTPSAHATSHNDGGADEIAPDWGQIQNVPSTFAPSAHDSSHEDGGADEMDLGAMAGTIDISDQTNAAADGEGLQLTGDSFGLELDGSTLVKSATGVKVSDSYNAPTATALAANGSNCGATQWAAGVSAAGVAEGCTTDDDVPESGDFGAAAALEADGSLSANSVDSDAYVDGSVDPEHLAATARRQTIIVEVFPPGTETATGDGLKYLPIPATLNGYTLTAVYAHVVSVGTTGTLNIDIARCATVATGNTCSGTVVDVLSTNLTIDSNESKSSTAAAAAVIDTSNDDVATDQVLRFDGDAVHTTPAEGLVLVLEFTP